MDIFPFPETINDSGKMLLRLFQIYRKYRNDKNGLTFEEWTLEMKTVMTLVEAVFKAEVNPLK
jgi:hypothetical protein